MLMSSSWLGAHVGRSFAVGVGYAFSLMIGGMTTLRTNRIGSSANSLIPTTPCCETTIPSRPGRRIGNTPAWKRCNALC